MATTKDRARHKKFANAVRNSSVFQALRLQIQRVTLTIVKEHRPGGKVLRRRECDPREKEIRKNLRRNGPFPPLAFRVGLSCCSALILAFFTPSPLPLFSSLVEDEVPENSCKSFRPSHTCDPWSRSRWGRPKKCPISRGGVAAPRKFSLYVRGRLGEAPLP